MSSPTDLVAPWFVVETYGGHSGNIMTEYRDFKKAKAAAMLDGDGAVVYEVVKKWVVNVPKRRSLDRCFPGFYDGEE